MADRKLKYTRDIGYNKTASKTLNNINPEATDEKLLLTVDQLAGLQQNEVTKVEKIESTVIRG